MVHSNILVVSKTLRDEQFSYWPIKMEHQKQYIQVIAFVLLPKIILKTITDMEQQVLLWRPCLNSHVLQECMPLNSISTQKTLKHLSLTHAFSLNPRLVSNYILFYFTVMSNKLSNRYNNKLLLPLPPIYHLTCSFHHFLHSIHSIHLGVILGFSLCFTPHTPFIRKLW